MKTHRIAYPLIVITFIGMMSCNSHRGYSSEEDYANPIDSIIHNTFEDARLEDVVEYLVTHPQFLQESEPVGYVKYNSDVYIEQEQIWADGEEFRIYSIPYSTNYSTNHNTFVQYKKDGSINFHFFEDCLGSLEGLYRIHGKNKSSFYIIKTVLDVDHQGSIKWEFINAFSFKNGRLEKEQIFHANNKLYDSIELQCGGQRYLPLDYNSLSLISMNDFEGRYETPSIIIAEINNRDWPTGRGLKYEWKGDWFEYVGKCDYDANGMF